MLDVLLAHLRTAHRDLVIQMAESLDPERRLPDAGYRQAQWPRPAWTGRRSRVYRRHRSARRWIWSRGGRPESRRHSSAGE